MERKLCCGAIAAKSGVKLPSATTEMAPEAGMT